jgi:hypothetical protein
VEYAEFDTERRRITRAWGREITDPEQLAAAVEALRDQAATIPGEAPQARAQRYLEALDDLVTEARAPESETVQRAGEVLLEASRPDGTAAERRARAEAGIGEITRIAEAAPTMAERDAALEMNESLAETVAALDAAAGQDTSARGSAVEARTAGFANDPALTAPDRMPAPKSAAVPNRTGGGKGAKAPVRDL